MRKASLAVGNTRRRSSAVGAGAPKGLKHVTLNFGKEYAKRDLPYEARNNMNGVVPESPVVGKEDLKTLFRKTSSGLTAKWDRLHRGSIKEDSIIGNNENDEQIFAKWDRLHRGSVKEDSLATHRLFRGSIIGESIATPVPLAGIDDKAEEDEIARRKQVLQRLLEPAGEDEAVPVRPINPKEFALISKTSRPPSSARSRPPSSQGVSNASAAPGSHLQVSLRSHYDFFEEISPGSGLRRRSSAMRAGAVQRLKGKLPSSLEESQRARMSVTLGTGFGAASSYGQPDASQPLSPPPPKTQVPDMKRGKSISSESDWQVAPGGKLSSAKRSACEAVRLVVLGRIGNEDVKTDRGRMKIFEESRGSEKEVVSLYKSWIELDEDESGDCDIREFLKYFRSRGLTSVGERALKGMFGGTNSGSTFTLENLMKIVWPCCVQEDIEAMRRMINEYRVSDKPHEETLPLGEDACTEISDVFVTADVDGNGMISKSELVDCGLFDEERALETLTRFGLGPDQELNWEQFLEVMCPAGFFVPAEFKKRTPLTAHGRRQSGTADVRKA